MTADPFFPLETASAGHRNGGTLHTIKPADVDALRTTKPAGKDGLRAILLAAILGVLATGAVLGVVSATAGLAVAGWIAGLAAGSAPAALLVAARSPGDQPFVRPADWVTLTRAVLVAAVAGMVADSISRPVSITALLTLSITALVLDAVDGQVARRTGTATKLGGRLDGEIDAFLILLLSIIVSRDYGVWVLAIGTARYALLLAGWLVPWLAAPLPPRYWRKVVAAVQGIVLTVAASGVPGRVAGMASVAAALLLLAESFGRDVIWLYRAGAGPRTRLASRIAVAVLAAAVLWSDLVAPYRAWQFSLAAFVRIPVEGLALVAVALVLPLRARRIVAAIAGFSFGLLAIDKILNLEFYENVDRAFNPVQDWVSIGPAAGVVRDAIGATATDIALGALAIGLILLVGAITASALHITAVAARHRRGAVVGLAVFSAAWVLCAGLSLRFSPGFPIASTSAAGLAGSQVRAGQAALDDPRVFERAIHSRDPQAVIPAFDLLTGLRGKDVIIAVVESYGQVAVRGTSFSPGVDAVLRRRTALLAHAGWYAQSAWLTSPTFGGISWLAHSTLQSGLWVNSTQRYAELVASNRFTLSDAFGKAGWRTVADDPSDNRTWLAGTSFYHYDQLYNRFNVGYRGPSFSFAKVPDQYTLAEFQRLELAPGHQPVMAEIDLVSSHIPWAPLPSMVSWNKIGDGSIFDPMPAKSESVAEVWRNASTVRKFYGRSIQYSMTALTSWVTELNDPNLVLILYGDHQPHTTVSGAGANHEVPISIIARDPAVFRQIASWHWQDGLLPGPDAPLEPMDAFRNQLLGAFSTTP
ncbi:MAG TPA: CDP-alcohol phosphatidyltransferase family protein [Streptosporangiaceae bacterium]|nr:CDP-alcohol phosphatidyltransferase family protein [Streptosporangiaceae bacterium]